MYSGYYNMDATKTQHKLRCSGCIQPRCQKRSMWIMWFLWNLFRNIKTLL